MSHNIEQIAVSGVEPINYDHELSRDGKLAHEKDLEVNDTSSTSNARGCNFVSTPKKKEKYGTGDHYK